MSDIGVIFIARGLDPHWQTRISRFVTSWLAHPPGIECQLYVTFKEFNSLADFELAQGLLAPLWPYKDICQYMGYNSWGGGCFKEAAVHVTEPLLCTLVSTTEIMHDNWLVKLFIAFAQLNAGLVGCTGSQECYLHVRDTAILLERAWHQAVADQFDFTSKAVYDEFEHGPNNLTLQTIAAGQRVFVVEKNRTIAPEEWAHTTYIGNLENVLVHDSGARSYTDGVRWN